jgi:hypothetical protein
MRVGDRVTITNKNSCFYKSHGTVKHVCHYDLFGDETISVILDEGKIFKFLPKWWINKIPKHSFTFFEDEVTKE